MKKTQPAHYFDRYDYELLSIVNEVLDSDRQTQALRSLFVEHMHPQGIKELAAPRGLRIASAIAGLLGAFETGKPSDRITALRSLRDEVLQASGAGFRKNTARVLIQIMKDLVRSRDNELHQLKLAHDFRMVSTGNPRLVRNQLAQYYLLEMPEEWSQYAFDDHVHDANTKGRKSPTHLIMDAWIKGIRFLTVIYYNYVSPEVVEELLEAAEILEVRVQVGIELTSRFRDKYVSVTWEPGGFSEATSFLSFLRDEQVAQLMKAGREVSAYQQQYVFGALQSFNNTHRHSLNRQQNLDIDELNRETFVRFVGAGQPSILHLARFIHNALSKALDKQSKAEDQSGKAEKQKTAHQLLDVDAIIEQFLLSSRNPELHDPTRPSDAPEVPAQLQISPPELLTKLLSLHSNSAFTLKLSNLSLQDTMELLYHCRGMITHIETFNLQNAAHGIASANQAERDSYAGEAVQLRSPEQHYRIIGQLQRALSEDNVIALKRVIREILWEYEEERHRLGKQIELSGGTPEQQQKRQEQLQAMAERGKALVDISFNLEKFHNFYRKRTLRSRVGSGSTGQAEHQHGMGLVVLDTLEPRARKAVREGIIEKKRQLIPVTALLTQNSYVRRLKGDVRSFTGRLAMKCGLPDRWTEKWMDWSLDGIQVHPGRTGNIATLGGLGSQATETANGAGGNSPDQAHTRKPDKTDHKKGRSWSYLNTNLKNSLKVLIGFVPAFLTFSLTKDWWVLAYFGAVIWFTITGSRNIIQSVLGGGGLRRSPLLPWNSLISWSRIADSLLYTGFSVPLLDFLTKTLLLDRTLGITTATNPILLYAVMGLANGIYISSHNIFRGLPRSAAFGNFFRSILAIPLAVLLNSLVSTILVLAGVPDVSGVLQKWAAIISKFASDCVAAIIEGLADRHTNITARLGGYRTKISQLFSVFSRLDMLFPEEDVLDLLQSPKMTMETLNYDAREQAKLLIVNALDLMYFWMFQPRARKAMLIKIEQMSQEEWLIFYRSQLVLNRYREISQLFVDGLVGRNFSKALAFYLDHFEEYLTALEAIDRKRQPVALKGKAAFQSA